MSVPIVLKEPEIKQDEITKWLRKHKLKKTEINITKATNALRAEKQADSIPLGRDISGIGSDALRRVIYGECVVPGTIVFIDSRANNQHIDLVVAIATHQINSIVNLYLDDCTVAFQVGSSGWSSHFIKPDGTIIPATNKVWMSFGLGTDAQAANANLTANNPTKWTADHKLSGCAYAYIILEWDGFLFGDGIPDISFRVQGKIVYDPRIGDRYTATTAVVIADYLTNTRFGLGVDYGTRIDEASLIAAADVCDQLVDLQGGLQEYRYAAHGYFDTGEAHGRVLERLAANMGGHITYSNGLWKFWPAIWREPVIVLTDDDIRGPIKIQTLATRDDIFNAVRGTFVAADQDFIVNDYPAVKNNYYATLDGEEIFENIDFHFVTSSATCQRLAKLELERIRQGIQIEVNVSLKAYQVQVPENIALTLERYGWDEKEFEVVKTNFVVSETDPPEIYVALSLRETDSEVFDWNFGEQTLVDLAPNTRLPSPFSVPVVSGLALESGTNALYRRGDGTIAPRIKVSWTAFSDFFLTSGGFVEIQFKQSASNDWIDSARVPGSSTFTYIVDVQDGVYYDVRARAVNTFGNVSDWTTFSMHFVVGKTAPPSDVAIFATSISEYGITFGWAKVTDFDLKEYEIREGASWTSATVVGRVSSISFNLNIRAAGSYTFLIKAIDTSGNYSTNATSTTVTIFAPTVASVSSSFEGNNVTIDWPEATIGSWAINIYDIYYGDVFSSATFLLSTKSSIAKVLVSWSGVRKFWVVCRDIHGNASEEVSVSILINAPNAITVFAATVIDNNVLCKWQEPIASTLPIAKYVIKKGDEYDSAETIGEMLGTFTVLFELLSGRYTYWVEAVDTAGNHGVALGTTVAVNEPPDFQLIASVELTDATGLINCRENPPGTILMPINVLRTWENHFIIQGWSTPQDQIDDGFPIFIQPTTDHARWEKITDIGTTVNNVLVHLDFTKTNIIGTPTMVTKIAYSTDGVSYTEESGVVALLAPAVRYIRVRLDYGTVP